MTTKLCHVVGIRSIPFPIDKGISNRASTFGQIEERNLEVRNLADEWSSLNKKLNGFFLSFDSTGIGFVLS
jgi:hypothetical protein